MNYILSTIAVSALVVSSAAYSAPITITGYDIENATTSGQGGWNNYYTGTITNTGPGKANYTGGSGTLNNGVIENASGGSQLFNYPSFHDPVITLYFDDFYVIDDLSLNAGPQGNSIPGKMTGLDLTIGSVIDSFLTVDVGNIIEFVDLAGSSLTGLTTNTLTLSGFDSSWSSYQTFNISEITLNGVQTDLAQVPEPSILALFGLGLAGFGFARRRKLQS